MKRALTLMTVTALGGAAYADTTVSAVLATPRTLATGAPACGNVMMKYAEDPVCPVIRNLRELEALGRKLDAALNKLAVETTTLTVAPRPRPWH